MTTQKVIRNVPAATLTEAGSQHVLPYKLVKIEFTSTTKYYSEGQSTIYGGNTYATAAVRVNAIRWMKDGTQSGSITLFNDENNDAASLVLSNRMAGNPIEVYQTYSLTPTTNADPVLEMVGVCSTSVLNFDTGEINVQIETAEATTLLLPNRYFTIAEGFNHIPPVGKKVPFSGELFEFERAT